MKLLKDFNPVKMTNLNAVQGGKVEMTGGTTNGHRDDMDVNGHFFCSNGDGSYSHCGA